MHQLPPLAGWFTRTGMVHEETPQKEKKKRRRLPHMRKLPEARGKRS